MDPTKQPGITIGQVYLEKAEFSHREDFLAYPPNTTVDLSIQFDAQYLVRPEGDAGVVRLVVYSDKSKNSLYEISVTIGALLQRTPGQENMQIEEFAANSASAFLFPFVREAVANLTSRGRFGPIWLHPINFQALQPSPTTTTSSTGTSGAVSSSKKKQHGKNARRKARNSRKN